MIRLGELKPGNIVCVKDEGVVREGVVIDISHEENMAQVDNGVQEFWYISEELEPIVLNDEELRKLGFEKHEEGDHVKYSKGAFRLLVPEKDNFSHIEMWYREDRRHFNHNLAVHELQNLHSQMTKVPLEKE